MFDVIAIGEILIDFTPAGLSPQGNALYEQNPGGAPANVLVALSRLGGNGCFIGKVGDDEFGHHLARVLTENGVSKDGLIVTRKANTTLAFVHLGCNGDRSFSFYRRPGADQLISFGEVNQLLLQQAKIFHFGAVCMTAEPARSTCLRSARYARKHGIPVSFDPNWRKPLWKDDNQAKKWMSKAVTLTDILKVSEIEMELLTGEIDPEKGSRILFGMGPSLVFVTLGESGCYFRCAGGCGMAPSYPVEAVDTTGAGDAFMAGILYRITKQSKPVKELPVQEIMQMVLFANAAGALCVKKRGAISAMPLLTEINDLLERNGKAD